jgi:hypothetical protein
MNRSVRRVMVGVAGLAVLGMTATLAGAQTDTVIVIANNEGHPKEVIW